MHPVLDTLCDPNLSMSKANSLVVKTQLFAALEKRMISRVLNTAVLAFKKLTGDSSLLLAPRASHLPLKLAVC